MDFKIIKNLYNQFIYSILYDYNKKRLINIFVTFFAIIGFLWGIVECFSWIFDKTNCPDTLRLYIKNHLKTGLIIVLLLSIYQHRRKRKIQNALCQF